MPRLNCADCDRYLVDWQNGGDQALRAMGVNLLYNDRISAQRSAIFHKYVTPSCLPEALQREFKKYHEERVRRRRDPDFILAYLNGNNLVTAYRRPTPLIRVLVLNGLGDVFQAASQRNQIFEYFPTKPTEDKISAWLDEELLGQNDAKTRQFVAAVLGEMDAERKKRAFQPVWTTLWDHFVTLEKEPPERWMEALGISWEPPEPIAGKPVARWVVLLRYTAGEAGTLVRPTQFDAGWYAAHFPSPEGADISLGGHPVDLGKAVLPAGLLPEFLHLEITHKPDHYYRIGRTENPARSGLPLRRHLHHQRLREAYLPKMDVYDWMPSLCTE